MVQVLIPIADGTEEMEAVIAADVLRRAQVEVCVASVMPDRKLITASRGVKIEADALLHQCLDRDWDLIVLPGGMPGALHLHDCTDLVQLLQRQITGNRWLAAICAAPAVVLGRHNLIPQAQATGYPSTQPELARQVAEVLQDAVVVDGKLITSQGPGTAMAFALKLVELLCGADEAQEVARGLVYLTPPTPT
jgi:4-methyl-5(b-hydroxyethyl)-thiazole monophosphate biosynthesis